MSFREATDSTNYRVPCVRTGPTSCVTLTGLIRSKAPKPLARPKRDPAEKRSDHALIKRAVEKSRIAGRTATHGSYPQAPKIMPVSDPRANACRLTLFPRGSARLGGGKSAWL